MKQLKDYIVDKKLSEKQVTTLSYDMEVKDDSNINQEIREILVDKGWKYTIPETNVISYSGKNRVEINSDTPMTTAWKPGVTPNQACKEFYAAIIAYNTNHSLDKPLKLARGFAFATCSNVYEAIKVE